MLNADDFNYDLSKCFVIYQGHHGDRGAQMADVILPGSAYTEKDGSFINLEGRLQYCQRAIFPPGEAKEDWAIIRALSEKLNKKIDFDNLKDLRDLMFKKTDRLDSFKENNYELKPTLSKRNFNNLSKLKSINKNFFMTCPISRTSNTMAECTKGKI